MRFLWQSIDDGIFGRETNVIAMRLGPGKHLKGRTLLGGIVSPEKFDYFHEVNSWHYALSGMYDISMGSDIVHHQHRTRTFWNSRVSRRSYKRACNQLAASLEIRLSRITSKGRTGSALGQEIYRLGNQWGLCWQRCQRLTDYCCEGWWRVGYYRYQEVSDCTCFCCAINLSSTASYLFRWITNGTFADYFTTGCKTEVYSFGWLFPSWLNV